MHADHIDLSIGVDPTCSRRRNRKLGLPLLISQPKVLYALISATFIPPINLCHLRHLRNLRNLCYFRHLRHWHHLRNLRHLYLLCYFLQSLHLICFACFICATHIIFHHFHDSRALSIVEEFLVKWHLARLPVREECNRNQKQKCHPLEVSITIL